MSTEFRREQFGGHINYNGTFDRATATIRVSYIGFDAKDRQHAATATPNKGNKIAEHTVGPKTNTGV